MLLAYEHVDPKVQNRILSVWGSIVVNTHIDDVPLAERIDTFNILKESIADLKALYSLPTDKGVKLRLEVDTSKDGIGDLMCLVRALTVASGISSSERCSSRAWNSLAVSPDVMILAE